MITPQGTPRRLLRALTIALTVFSLPLFGATRPVSVLIELSEEPTARTFAAAMAADTRSVLSTHASRVEAAHAAAVAQLSVVSAQQDRLTARLRSGGISTTPIYRVQRVLNGVAVEIDPADLERLKQLPEVRNVRPLALEYPSASNSVPFLNVPAVWQMPLGAGKVDGTGVKLGIIDTGIDYIHADFGGPGTQAAYLANVRTVAPDQFFPTTKVVGGKDFAGDRYNGTAATITPDPDPMDCNGHGTHVAGIASGLGVKTDGTTYTGPYDATTPFATLRIHPGVAPKAQLYALRVFGCGGGTNLTVKALDWAADPNEDGNFADHLDVVNMSLGSDFGTIESSTGEAADNAAVAGVTVVASAGNSGDTYFISGSPAASDRVLSVAATVDNGFAATSLRVNAPASIAGTYANTVAIFGAGPPPAGLTGNVVIAMDEATPEGPSTTDGCTALTNADALRGNIAMIDRSIPPASGNSPACATFVSKVKNAQSAGAIAVIIANSTVGAFGSLGGSDATITIPAVMVSNADASKFKANIAGLNVTLFNGGDTLTSFSSRGPRGGSPSRLKPDVSAPGFSIVSAQTGTTCTGNDPSTGCISPATSGIIAGSQALSLNGTSMAAPQVAGVATLMRQLHPDWTPEEIKASIMNGAAHDVTQPPSTAQQSVSRVGAGRTDALASAQLSTLAFNADEPGVVSVTFIEDFTQRTTRTRKVKVENKSATQATFELSVLTTVDAPGVRFIIPPAVAIPPNSSMTFDVQLEADPAAMDQSRDAAVPATLTAPPALVGLTTLNRTWLPEESALLIFKSGGVEKMRVPLYSAGRPASVMFALPRIDIGSALTGSTSITLSGTGVCTGNFSGGRCAGDFTTDRVSLVTPFELQVSSPRRTSLPPELDLQYAGVAYDPANNLIMFGLTTWGDWASPTDVTFNVYIDANEDGTFEHILFNSNPGTMSDTLFDEAASAQDVFIDAIAQVGTENIAFGGPGLYVNNDPALMDTALMRNNVMVLRATPAQLGLAAGDTHFRYKILTCPGDSPLCRERDAFQADQEAGPFAWDYANQGVNFNGTKFAQDLPGQPLPLSWNVGNFRSNSSLGILLLHHFNATGSRAERITLATSGPPRRRAAK